MLILLFCFVPAGFETVDAFAKIQGIESSGGTINSQYLLLKTAYIDLSNRYNQVTTFFFPFFRASVGPCAILGMLLFSMCHAYTQTHTQDTDTDTHTHTLSLSRPLSLSLSLSLDLSLSSLRVCPSCRRHSDSSLAMAQSTSEDQTQTQQPQQGLARLAPRPPCRGGQQI